MHPSQAIGFEWDDANEAHLADHSIAPWEVEQVFLNAPVWAPDRKNRGGAWKMVGWTDGGRALAIIVELIEPDGTPAMLRASTGWGATTADFTRYLSRRRRR